MPDLKTLIDNFGLTIVSEFVPFTQSRSLRPSLNWRVTVLHRGQFVLTTDYTAGVGHCPSFKYPETVESQERTLKECAHGRRATTPRTPILPDTVDVIAALAHDAAVIDYPVFEDWARDYDFDPDSRRGETLYRTCLSHALALRLAVGDAHLAQLREAAQEH